MYRVSTRFLQAVRGSARVISEVVLFRTDGSVERLDHIGGSVTVDRGRAIRRSCSVEIADPALIPRTAADKLATYGARLRVSTGFDYGDGTSELVPLGLFRLDSVSGDPDTGPATLTGTSLEAVVADDKFTEATRVSGTAVGDVTALIQASLPDAAVVTAPEVVDAVIGSRTWNTQGDRWAAVLECAAAVGAEVYCDPDGVFTIAVLPDLLTTTPVWSIDAGPAGVYVSADRGMNSDGVYNGIVASGENTETDTAPVSVLVVDDDPDSPTYWHGPFGHRPTFYSSSTLTSANLATAAANLLLRAAVAPNATADISSIPNPALEPGDVLRVAYPDGSRELHQVQSFTVPIATGAFTVRTISAKEDS